MSDNSRAMVERATEQNVLFSHPTPTPGWDAWRRERARLNQSAAARRIAKKGK